MLLIAFLLSGAAALGYELLWTRLLGLALGNEVLGVFGVLTGFFGGIALGSAVFHERARNSPDPVRLFAVLEVGAAAFALVSPYLLHTIALGAPALLGGFAGDNDSVVALTITVTIAGVTLLPGTVCMGATLPALVEARRREAPDETHGRGLSRLYAANTVGATVGVMVSVHLLLPALGFAAAAVVLSALGFVAAALAWRWRQGGCVGPVPPRPVSTVVDTSGDPDPHLTDEPRLLYMMAFGGGLAGIGLEVAGVQALGQILENTVYTFAAILSVYLVGTAAGSWLYARHAARAVAGPPAIVLAGLLLALAASTVLAAIGIGNAPSLLETLAPEGASYPAHLAAEAAVAAAVFVVPTLLMGAFFGHVVGLIAPAGVGRAYAINTLGSALAPFVFGVWAVPQLGITGAFYLVAYAYIGLFAVFTWFRRFKSSWQIAGILGAVLLTSAGPRSLLLVKEDDDWTILEQHETVMGLVIVAEKKSDEDADTPPLRRLRVGKHFRMGGALAFGERRMGHLPLLLHSDPKSALFLGVGTGATLGAVKDYDLDHVEAVELVPAVLDTLHYFDDTNGNVRQNPRVQLHAADARRYLAAAAKKFDVIVADLFHPARDGAGSLYALEHFQQAHDHLNNGGLFAQWLPLHQIAPPQLKTIIRTFLEVFPETHSWLGIYNVQTPGMVLLGRRSGDPLSVDAARLGQQLQRPIYGALLMNDIRDILGAYMLDRVALEKFAGDAPLNTDLDPRVAFDAPEYAYTDPKDLNWRSLQALLPARTPLPPNLLHGTRTDALYQDAARFSRALETYLEGEMIRVRTGTSKIPLAAVEKYVQAYEIEPQFVPARGVAYQTARQDRDAAELIYPRFLARTPDEIRVYKSYLSYLQAIGDQKRFDQVMMQAKARFDQDEGPPPDHASDIGPVRGPD